jgi:hypothetical protein
LKASRINSGRLRAMSAAPAILLAAGVLAGVAAPASASAAARGAGATATAVAAPASTSGSCAGYSDLNLPRSGDLADPALNSAGFVDTGSYTSGGAVIVCIKSVREWVYYSATATKTWQVYINGKFAAQATFTLSPGYYYWDFSINNDYVQPSKACVLATGTPGHSCVYFDYLGRRLSAPAKAPRAGGRDSQDHLA